MYAQDDQRHKDEDEIDELMEDQEEMDDVRGTLKIPKDVLGEDEDEDEDGEGLLGDKGSDEEDEGVFGEGDDDEEDAENDIFALARENQELGDPTA